ncbi:hypothetical protein BKG94_03525 [Rodentibacter ratti]|uniref:hypothetical protein n=1 Tax=Rodentibacter ratti TaxID=1906745 RepID=UPI0009841E94|nr:hypothetical protein [Rodentibacter ratti]OOF89023.1 hypothetical protein BKG94_03525 [Rodentibacter ratti]
MKEYFTYDGNFYILSIIIIIGMVLFVLYKSFVLSGVIGGRCIYSLDLGRKNQKYKYYINFLMIGYIGLMFSSSKYSFEIFGRNVLSGSVIMNAQYIIILVFLVIFLSLDPILDKIIFKENGVFINYIYYPYNKVSLFKPAAAAANHELHIYGVEVRIGGRKIIIPCKNPMTAFFNIADVIKRKNPNIITDYTADYYPGNTPIGGGAYRVWDYTQEERERYTEKERSNKNQI